MRYILKLDAISEIGAIFLGFYVILLDLDKLSLIGCCVNFYVIYCRIGRYFLKLDAILLDFDNLSWIGHCFNCTLFIVESDDIFWRWTLFFFNCTFCIVELIERYFLIVYTTFLQSENLTFNFPYSDGFQRPVLFLSCNLHDYKSVNIKIISISHQYPYSQTDYPPLSRHRDYIENTEDFQWC